MASAILWVSSRFLAAAPRLFAASINSAARRSAKEARELAEKVRTDLAQLERQSQNRWSQTTGSVDSLRKDMDDRVGQVAVDLSGLGTALGSGLAEEQTVNTAQDTTISALREYVGLSDKRLQQAIKRLKENRRKAAEKLRKEEEKRRRKAEKDKK